MAKELNEMNEKELSIFKASKSKASKECRNRRLESIKSIIDFIETNISLEDQPANLQNDIQRLKGEGRMSSMISKRKVIADFLNENGSVSEIDIFTEFQLGRMEMRSISNDLIKKENPANRIWIDFDPETKEYSIMGTGPDQPNGWRGYKLSTTDYENETVDSENEDETIDSENEDEDDIDEDDIDEDDE